MSSFIVNSIEKLWNLCNLLKEIMFSKQSLSYALLIGLGNGMDIKHAKNIPIPLNFRNVKVKIFSCSWCPPSNPRGYQ